MIVEFHDLGGMDPPGIAAPFAVTLLRRLASTDGAQYWLARPEVQIDYPKAGATVKVGHVIVSPGWMGMSFEKPFHNARVNLAYVIDDTQVTQDAVEFSKCDYVAYGNGSIVNGRVS